MEISGNNRNLVTNNISNKVELNTKEQEKAEDVGKKTLAEDVVNISTMGSGGGGSTNPPDRVSIMGSGGGGSTNPPDKIK
jgi:hypothetical protein